jgi:hypothetical protein
MTNAGAVVFDHMPHGSFSHVSGGAVSMDFSSCLKLIPYECLVGGCIAGVFTLTCQLARMSLTTMARRIKDGLMMRMDLMELLCLSPGKSVHPPDGHDVAQMVFIL